MERGNDKDDANHHNNSKGLRPLPSSSTAARLTCGHLQCLWAAAVLWGGHTDQGKLMKRVEEYSGLPSDVLVVICKKLDIDDLFQFAVVCKDWRTFHKSYWRKFMVSHAPLLIHTSYADKTYFFVSLCEQKIYSAKMDYFWGYSYAGFSRGYVIMARANNTLLLLNPFTRRKKEISGEAFQKSLMPLSCHAILAYAKDSEELIIVLRCEKTSSLYIYQSQNSCWATHSRWGEPWRVVDFVVFHHAVYVITNEAKIGVLSLKSTTLKFLELNNVPSLTSSKLKLVSSDGNLLVVHFELEKLEVYKIDFSSMDWVKLETLGDVTLFYSKRTKCYALSNPGIWGYERNCVYYIDQTSSLCKVYSMDNKRLPGIFPGGTQAPPMSRPYCRIGVFYMFVMRLIILWSSNLVTWQHAAYEVVFVPYSLYFL